MVEEADGKPNWSGVIVASSDRERMWVGGSNPPPSAPSQPGPSVAEGSASADDEAGEEAVEDEEGRLEGTVGVVEESEVIDPLRGRLCGG